MECWLQCFKSCFDDLYCFWYIYLLTNIDCGVVSVNTFNGHGLLAFVAFEWNNAVLDFSGFEIVDLEVYTRLKGVAGEVVDVSNIYSDVIGLGEAVDLHVRLKVGASAAEVVKLYSR